MFHLVISIPKDLDHFNRGKLEDKIFSATGYNCDYSGGGDYTFSAFNNEAEDVVVALSTAFAESAEYEPNYKAQLEEKPKETLLKHEAHHITITSTL